MYLYWLSTLYLGYLWGSKNHLGNPDFSTQTSYDEHMYQTADGGYKCKYCGKETARKWHMKNHVEIHLENSYQCRECLIVLKTRNALMKHQAKKHSLHPYWINLRLKNSNYKKISTLFLLQHNSHLWTALAHRKHPIFC